LAVSLPEMLQGWQLGVHLSGPGSPKMEILEGTNGGRNRVP
jgi:hypothetical protein